MRLTLAVVLIFAAMVLAAPHLQTQWEWERIEHPEGMR